MYYADGNAQYAVLYVSAEPYCYIQSVVIKIHCMHAYIAYVCIYVHTYVVLCMYVHTMH